VIVARWIDRGALNGLVERVLTAIILCPVRALHAPFTRFSRHGA
jgi:hypothetical protein